MHSHTIHLPPTHSPYAQNQILLIDGDEATHALQVKRVRVGDLVRLLDGAGGSFEATVVAAPTDSSAPNTRKRERTLHVQIIAQTAIAPESPALDVFSATPKGHHIDDLIEGLSQVGAASWTPLHAARSVVDPRPSKLDRLDRISIEAMKQCGRAHHLRINPSIDFLLAVGPAHAASDRRVILADASGSPYVASQADHIRLLVGPEGGWTPSELDAARAADVQACSFGRHVMRIETAAVVAAAIIMAHSAPA